MKFTVGTIIFAAMLMQAGEAHARVTKDSSKHRIALRENHDLAAQVKNASQSVKISNSSEGAAQFKNTSQKISSQASSAGEKTAQTSNTSGKAAQVSNSTSDATSSPRTYKATTATDWIIESDMSGPFFWDHWNFFEGPDPTRGLVNYVNKDKAFSSGLAGSRSLFGPHYMRVDNKTPTKPNGIRNSVRISAKQKMTYPSMLILDANHLAYGMTTWPAFWIIGDGWPTGGELDIYEGTNLQKVNQMGAHTKPGCTLKTPMALEATGAALTTDCDALIQSNTGCVVRDAKESSYGEGFANAGGGVYATVWDKNGISIYHFPRKEVPWDIELGLPNPSKWGAPSAMWASENCDTSEFFAPQTVTFDITICGDWAKSTWSSEYKYPGQCGDAVANSSNYDPAYFDINFVRIYKGLAGAK